MPTSEAGIVMAQIFAPSEGYSPRDVGPRDSQRAGDGADVAGDIVIRAGRIVSIGDAAPSAGEGVLVEGHGHLALPGFVDGHAHLDKTTWGLPWRPHSATPGLAGLIENERSGRRTLPPVATRAAALLAEYSANGTTVIRTHVDVDVDAGLTSIEGVLEAAAEFADRIDVQVVAFPQSGLLVAPGTADLLDAAIRAGASVVGGIDPAQFDGDAVAHLDCIFGIADRHGCGIDVHLHDRGSLGRWELGLVIERTRALGLQGKVTLSHAFCLCDGDAAVAPLIEQLGEHRIGLATVAPGNVDPLPLDLIDEYGSRSVSGRTVFVIFGRRGATPTCSPGQDSWRGVRALGATATSPDASTSRRRGEQRRSASPTTCSSPAGPVTSCSSTPPTLPRPRSPDHLDRSSSVAASRSPRGSSGRPRGVSLARQSVDAWRSCRRSRRTRWPGRVGQG